MTRIYVILSPPKADEESLNLFQKISHSRDLPAILRIALQAGIPRYARNDTYVPRILITNNYLLITVF